MQGNRFYQASLSTTSFFMGTYDDNLDVDTALKVVDHTSGHYEGASLDIDDMDIIALVKAIDDLVIY